MPEKVEKGELVSGTDLTNNGVRSRRGFGLECLNSLNDIELQSLYKFGEYPELNGTRMLIGLTLIGTCISEWDWLMSALCSNVATVLIEAKILKIISSIFLSSSIVWSLINITMIAVMGLLFEEIKGTYTLIIYVIIVAIGSQLITLLFYLSMYYVTWNTFYLESKVCGLSCVLGAFAVILAEVSPNSVLIKNSSSFVIRSKYLAFLLTIGMLFMSMFEIFWPHVWLITSGMYCAWIFLRYFQSNKGTGMKGNGNDEFALAKLFPPIIRIPMILISNCCYTICDTLGFCHVTRNATSNVSNISNISDIVNNEKTSNNVNLANTERSNLNNNLSINIDRNGFNSNGLKNIDMIASGIDTQSIESTPVDPEEQKRREDAKKEIERRLEFLRQDIQARRKDMQNRK